MAERRQTTRAGPPKSLSGTQLPHDDKTSSNFQNLRSTPLPCSHRSRPRGQCSHFRCFHSPDSINDAKLSCEGARRVQRQNQTKPNITPKTDSHEAAFCVRMGATGDHIHRFSIVVSRYLRCVLGAVAHPCCSDHRTRVGNADLDKITDQSFIRINII